MSSVTCSTLAYSSSTLIPENFLSSAKIRPKRAFPVLAPANNHGRRLSTTAAVLANLDDGKPREQVSPSNRDLQNMAKTLAGIACGVVACTSVAWDVTAFADVPPGSTPYSKAADRFQVGLVKGRIQACPLDVNPNCVSTSSNNGGYAAPWILPESSTSSAAKKIETAILSTQKNPAIMRIEETPGGGTYLVAEADGFLGRDVMEFLVRDDVVTYRSMAKKVVYLYPFTTPIGDFDEQQKHLRALQDELGWGAPTYESTYDEDMYSEEDQN